MARSLPPHGLRIAAAIPVLPALGIPAIVMTRRVRQQERLGRDAMY
ncbi:hypothetical protein [Streptomyces sp. NBC_00893]|nr:hypothetical protein [Streptomyces sp. NBC_00893]MCX4851452.1 hypothetical protein [Streptomyces sp. NBC_00893]